MIYCQILWQRVRRNYTNEVNQALSRCFLYYRIYEQVSEK